jgi:hypothetical protein
MHADKAARETPAAMPAMMIRTRRENGSPIYATVTDEGSPASDEAIAALVSVVSGAG